MGKNNANKKKESAPIEPVYNEGDLVVNGELKFDSIEIGKIKTCSFNPAYITNVNIIELVALERACSLLCKRYETVARLDSENNIKFKEYKGYYDMIFEELEKRVYESCKK